MSFDDLRDLYQEVILQHGRHPSHAGKPETYAATAKGDNPMCGDRVQVFLSYDAEGRIVDPRFDARGCAISIASADLMAEAVAGLAPDEARRVFLRFRDMARTGACPDVGCDDGIAAAVGRRAPVPKPREMRDFAVARADGGARRGRAGKQ